MVAEPTLDEAAFHRIAKALCDPQRFEILELVAGKGELACNVIVASFPIAQPTTSHHLRELAAAGLLERTKEGQYAFYRFLPEVMRAYVAELRRRTSLDPPPPSP